MENKWTEELAKEENNTYFSQLTHNYFKLAALRVFQEMRDKHRVPPEDCSTLLAAISARMLNESVYRIGALLSKNYKIEHIFLPEQLERLISILHSKPLDSISRTDIETDLYKAIEGFKKFIQEKAFDFYM